MAIDQASIAAQLIAQLRVLDPSASAEVGTPERKILDTVAQSITETAIDLNLLSGALDLSAKFGTDLDAYLGQLGFGRQAGASSTGFITFSRSTASPYDIVVPRGTQVMGTGDNPDNSVGAPFTIVFMTTAAVTLLADTTSITAPIQALIQGKQGNVAANTITSFANVGAPPLGITSVTNPLPTVNGSDVETDAELKVRFRNTVFRNLAGTQDQFLALAIATQFSTKANVIGPISRYQEYIQVPAVDDITVDPMSGFAGNGVADQWTTALSDNPFAKYIYANVPYFVTNGAGGIATIFYRQDTDFLLNNPPVNLGDTYRELQELVGPDPITSPYTPNVSFYNIYRGADETVQLIRPSDVVLLEYSYLSEVSRNDIVKNITNCVDVFVNGENPTTANAIIPPPTIANVFVNNPINKYYVGNYRRIGEKDHKPVVGNLFTALFFQPTIELPDQIVVDTNTYFRGIHYWAVEDVSGIGNTVRTRNGIEWLPTLPGLGISDPPEGPYTGNTIVATGATSLTIPGYIYDRNIIDLQVALEGEKQVTTDILAHRGITRYFKLDITVMYNPGVSVAFTNSSIQQAMTNFFNGQYFGTVIQLSDLLQTIHNVVGVNNVRWSREVLEEYIERVNPTGPIVDQLGNGRFQVTECNIDGNPRSTVIVDRIVPGNGSTSEVWQAYFAGNPTAGSYKITQGTNTTASILFGDSVGTVQTKLVAAGINATTSGSASSYTITFTSVGYQTNPLVVTSQLTGAWSFDADFFLRDNELPALPVGTLSTDTLAGLVIRPRAQGTWGLL